MKEFPWENAMKFGLGVLGLSPQGFWAMTPRELNAAFCAHLEMRRGAGATERETLEKLLKEFPDGKETTEHV